jgi:hypothetical protein
VPKRKPLTPDEARATVRHRWDHDPAGIDKRINELVARMPAATDEQRTQLALLLTIPPAQRDHRVAS